MEDNTSYRVRYYRKNVLTSECILVDWSNLPKSAQSCCRDLLCKEVPIGIVSSFRADPFTEYQWIIEPV